MAKMRKAKRYGLRKRKAKKGRPCGSKDRLRRRKGDKRGPDKKPRKRKLTRGRKRKTTKCR